MAAGIGSRTGLGCMLAALAAWHGAAGAAYDFAYQLSGDRRVAPVQVFDDGATTWLQFLPGQTLPAVFAERAGAPGPELAVYTQQGPYLVLEGTAPALELRIGAIGARAEYVGQAPRRGLASPGSSAVADPPVEPPAGQAGASAARFEPVSTARRAAGASAPAQGPDAATAPAEPAAAPRAAVEVRAVLEFDAAPGDQNMRRVLERWARDAGWLFGPEHWTVDVDIPLVGAASFGADFRHAVRGLLGATELGERPLQPCFYSNRVLRVVPSSQACDRTAAPAPTAAKS